MGEKGKAAHYFYTSLRATHMHTYTTMTTMTMHNNNTNKNMKKKVSLGLWSLMMMIVALVGLVVAPRGVKGQSDSSPVKLSDDAAVDAFAQVILENGGVFEGNITINGVVTSLKGLEGLTSVGGHVYILGIDQLTSLAGLAGLTSVGGRVFAYLNPQLQSLAGLESLTVVD